MIIILNLKSLSSNFYKLSPSLSNSPQLMKPRTWCQRLLSFHRVIFLPKEGTFFYFPFTNLNQVVNGHTWPGKPIYLKDLFSDYGRGHPNPQRLLLFLKYFFIILNPKAIKRSRDSNLLKQWMLKCSTKANTLLIQKRKNTIPQTKLVFPAGQVPAQSQKENKNYFTFLRFHSNSLGFIKT